MEIIQYVAAIAVFIVAVYFLKRFNQGVIQQNTGKADDYMKKIADALGLQYEAKPAAQGKDVVMDMGGRVYGTYNGLPVEIAMSNTTRVGPTGTRFTSTMQRTLTLKVPNPKGRKFHILPKDGHVVAEETASNAFNQKLSYVGDPVVPKETLDYFGKMGWMNLALKGDELLFHDTFYDQFQGLNAMQAMTAKHPVWGTTAGNPNVDVAAVRLFLDSIVAVAQKAGAN